MSEFKYSGSHAASRLALLEQPPTFSHMIKIINDNKSLTTEQKSILFVMLLAGCRVSEAIQLKIIDCHFYGYNNSEVPQKDLYLHNVAKVILNLKNLKNKTQPFKRAVIIKNELFITGVEAILNRVQELIKKKSDLSTRLYSGSRKTCWWLVKKTFHNSFENNMWPHGLRHIYCSNLAIAGAPLAVIKSAAGWKSSLMLDHYAHFSTKDLERTLLDSFGAEAKEIGDPSKPLTDNQIIGGFLAAKEIKQIETEPFKQKKSIFVNNNGKLDAIHVSAGARQIRDQIRINNPLVADKAKQELLTARAAIAAKKQKTILSQNKETDLSTLVAVV